MFTLAHATDWHTTALRGAGAAPFVSKRFFGWLSWNVRRHRLHRPEVLEALFEDLEKQGPDHVAITGDLTNVALPQEFEEAAGLLRRLGPPEWVSAIPGNHDAYVAVPPEQSWDLWAPYLVSDSAAVAAQAQSANLAGTPATLGGTPASLGGTGGTPVSLGGTAATLGGTVAASTAAAMCAPRAEDFPTLRVRGEVAVVGLCTALPTPLFQASGLVGEAQLARLEPLLLELRERDLFRVVLVHHPITDVELEPRRRLRDADALCGVLARAGAELVLHGHRHRTVLATTRGPEGEIPVVGARSASDVGEKEYKRAQYHLYGIERREGGGGAGPRYRITLRIRGWEASSRTFRAEEERVLV